MALTIRNAGALPAGEGATVSGGAVTGLGDVNGDGIDDFAVSNFRASERIPGTNDRIDDTGEVFVVFGVDGGFGDVDIQALDGTDGFSILGPEEDAEMGRSLKAAGDINGDGINDIIASTGDIDAGDAIIIFGSSDVGAASRVIGPATDPDRTEVPATDFLIVDVFGFDEVIDISQSSGDINGDGFDDLALIATGSVNSAFVALGQNGGRTSDIDDPATDGILITGLDDSRTYDLSIDFAGDINGDGFDELIIGNPDADRSNDARDVGAAYVIFGGAFSAGDTIDFSNLDDSNEFRFEGSEVNDNVGDSVTGLGDVNGDGFDDFAIASSRVDRGAHNEAGQVAIFFGTDDPQDARIFDDDLDSDNGILLLGEFQGDRMGSDIAGAGDINGDGFDDILIGAFLEGSDNADAAYLILGDDSFARGGLARY